MEAPLDVNIGVSSLNFIQANYRADHSRWTASEMCDDMFFTSKVRTTHFTVFITVAMQISVKSW